jgi:hypothetical protein
MPVMTLSNFEMQVLDDLKIERNHNRADDIQALEIQHKANKNSNNLTFRMTHWFDKK